MKTEYRKCPKCELNYIPGGQTACSVCESAGAAYRGSYCEKCGEIIFDHLFKYRDANNGTERKEILHEAEIRMCDCENYLYDYPFPDIDEAYRFITETVLRRV